jgi:hypothetical protein
MLQGWVAVGVITAEQQTELLNVATKPCSRAEELGLGEVTINDLIDSGVV